MSVAPTDASVLELFHPLGHADTVRVIGRACHQELDLCPRQITQSSGAADLVVLAPSAEELATPGWLEDAVREAAGSLQRDGVLYVLAHRSRRRKLHALLQARGLVVANTLLHHPDWSHAGTLVPLKPQALTYAFSRLIPTHPVRRRIALGLMRLPGVLPLVRAVLPYVGLVVQWHGAPAQSTWFTKLVGERGRAGDIVLNTSWRGRDGAVLLHAVDADRGEATAIAKTWLSANGDAGGDREALGLQEIAARAGQFGARVPKLLGQGMLVGRPYVAETVVAGEKAASVLRHNPQPVERLLTRLANWLLGWNTGTRHDRVLSEALLREMLLDPIDQFLPATDRDQGHRRLSELASRLLGQTTPFVATHGDLTMVNVLVDGSGSLGIIDWETASASGLPMADFFYAAVDAVAAIGDYRDRPGAFAQCFGLAGRYRPLIAQLQDRFTRELRLTSDQVALSFYASWFKFALAERREAAKAAPNEFLTIAREAATGNYANVTGHNPVC